MSGARTNLWLFVLLVLVAAAHLCLNLKTPVSPVLQLRSLYGFATPIRAVALERPNEPKLELRKEFGEWHLEAPYKSDVDSEVVLRLVDSFQFEAIEDSLSGRDLERLGRTRADFGLDEPRLTVTLESDLARLRILFGAYTASSNGVYAAIEDSDMVLVVPEKSFALTNLKAEAFRKREIFPYLPDFVTSFELRTPDSTVLAFSREGEGWRIGGNAASLARVSEFLKRLSQAKAIDFLWPVEKGSASDTVSPTILAGYGLDAGSAVSVTLRCQDGSDRRIVLGAAVGKDKTYALVNGGSAVVTVDSALKAAAVQGAQVFTDSRLFPLDESLVSSYMIADRETTYVVARASGGTWRLDAPISAAADSETATALLGRILSLTSADLDEHGLKVSVSTNLPAAVVSAKSLLGQRSIGDLRSREMLNVDRRLVRRLVMTPGEKSMARHISVAYDSERAAWHVENDPSGELTVDPFVVKRICAALNPLRASSVEAIRASATDLARYGLEKPYFTLSFDQEKAGAFRRNILIGNVTKGGRYATVGSSDAVFVLPTSTVEILTYPMVED